MRISVNPDRCQGHAMCHMLAPDLIVLSDEDGHATAAVDEVPEGQQRLAQLAAEGCPEQAIILS
jgi:ferredoxin